jgi:hypothetical protein
MIEKTRGQILQGLNATKLAVAFDEYGNRHTIETPDHGQRRSYAKLALELEGLYPTHESNGVNPLPDSGSQGASSEVTPDVRNQIARLTPADKMLARDAYTALQRARTLAEREVFEEKTGMSPEQFREELQSEVDARLRAQWGRTGTDEAAAIRSDQTGFGNENE